MISKSRNIFLGIIVFLAILIPPALATGPFLPDLFISLIGIIYIYLNIKNINLTNLYQNKFISFFLSFYFFIIVSTIFSYEPLVSMENSLFYFRFLFFSLAIFFILQNYDNFIKYLIISFSITFIVIYFDSILQLTLGNNLTGYPIDEHGGINSFFGTNADGILGSYIVRLTPIFCALLSYQFYNDRGIRILILLIIVGSCVISLLSQERTAFAFSLIVFFSYVYLTNAFSLKIKLFISLTLLILIFLVLLLNEDIYTRYIVSVKDQFFNNNQFYIFSSLHQAHYDSAIKMFLDKPILGIGPKMFRYYCDFETYYVLNSCSTHPHNSYIQLMAETGIIPFLFLLIIFIFFLKIYIKQFLSIFKNKNAYYSTHFILMLSSVFISLFPLAPTGSFFNNWLNVIYYFPVGFLIFFIKTQKYKNKT